MELFTVATTLVAAIDTANKVYKTLKTGKKNLDETWSLASRFFDAKAKVDAYAEVDEKNNNLTTEAFIKSILFRRYEKEVNQIMLAFLDGSEIAMWEAHKKAVKEHAKAEAEEAMERERRAKKAAALKQMHREENLRYGIIGFTIAGIVCAAGTIVAVAFGIV